MSYENLVKNIDTTNASNITSGTLANTQLTSQVTLQSNTFNGASQLLQFDASSNYPAGAGASITSLNASNISSGTISNSYTTGVSTNTSNTLVLRDGSGNFSAGTITATLNGSASSTSNLTGGIANNIPYQTGVSTTSFITNANNSVLVTNGSGVPSWSTSLPTGVTFSSLGLSNGGTLLNTANVGFTFNAPAFNWNSGGSLPSPSGSFYNSISYGNGTLVSLVYNSTISAYSTNNGQSWSLGGVLPTSSNWVQSAYGNGAFVAIAASSTNTAISTNGGMTWVAGGAMPTSVSWNSIAYGLIGSTPTFVAVAISTSTAAYSNNNGLTWTSTTMPASAGWNSVAFGGGNFVAIAQSSTDAAYSTNGGITWTAATLPANEIWQGLAYGNGVFVAVAYATTVTAYSTNGGATWTLGGAMPASSDWAGVTYNNGVFVAIAQFSSQNAYSTNGGITWTAATLPSSSTWSSITSGNGNFVTVSSAASAISAYGFYITEPQIYGGSGNNQVPSWNDIENNLQLPSVIISENYTWIPTDGSGASLTFTGVTATYSQIGNIINFTVILTYPSTASGALASIAGLPFTAYSLSIVTGLASNGVPIVGRISASGNSIALYDTATGGSKTNSAFSTATITLTGTYSN